ncbi:MAG TPA: aminotransferase class V-fold PLP-dependent enzyme [bacterium]|nr:aminotransferase class V-fold PLP-dependent enzyme [bacterium]HMW35815.1 aminotransferase class V-fold PLP-dependent enzyme [bacterium]HMZ03255.1 aminotransferase class V-fold PLP-dependent enzyme [bacterium]HNB08126.1 aminotransferase class V-fold PLP-dependent enzyme [bacterium]HNC47389.1 aminotransferase class V-fold PLP-dependent enzyme [bacterium]
MSILHDNFLGPKAENAEALQESLIKILDWHAAWRRTFFTNDPEVFDRSATPSDNTLQKHLDVLLERLSHQPPYFSPRYAAQMLKDPALSSTLGYLAAILTNPNNHAYEGGPITTELEMECVQDLLNLCGFKKGWGHLCSGGSLANTEAMWAVRDVYTQKHKKPGAVLFSHMAHYSWKRICSILAIQDGVEIPTDSKFRMDLDALESVLKKKKTMMVVANIGTTGVGAVDDIEGILQLRKRYGFHLHLDAAYGGYSRSIIIDASGRIKPYANVALIVKPEVYLSLRAMKDADSITIDPHKQGALGYGCGAVIYKSEALRSAILNTAPYTYHIKDKPNIGMFTLEGSRPGAVAAGCWLTHRMMPLHEEGYGRLLTENFLAAQELHRRIESESGFRPLHDPDLDIYSFYKPIAASKTASLQKQNKLNTSIYEAFSVLNPKAPFILSKFVVDAPSVKHATGALKTDDRFFLSLRTVLIKHWMRMSKPSYVDLLIEALREKRI